VAERSDPQAWLGEPFRADVVRNLDLRVGCLRWFRQRHRRTALLAGSHLTRPMGMHCSDHLLSRVRQP